VLKRYSAGRGRRGPAPPPSRFRPSPSRDFALACPCSCAASPPATSPAALRPRGPLQRQRPPIRPPRMASGPPTSPFRLGGTCAPFFPLNFYALDSRLMGAAAASGGACRVPPLLTAAHVRPTATLPRRWTERGSDLASTMRYTPISSPLALTLSNSGVPQISGDRRCWRQTTNRHGYLRRRGAHGPRQPDGTKGGGKSADQYIVCERLRLCNFVDFDFFFYRTATDAGKPPRPLLSCK